MELDVLDRQARAVDTLKQAGFKYKQHSKGGLKNGGTGFVFGLQTAFKKGLSDEDRGEFWEVEEVGNLKPAVCFSSVCQ